MERKEAKPHDDSTAANERKVRNRDHNITKGGEKVAVTPRYPGDPARTVWSRQH